MPSTRHTFSAIAAFCAASLAPATSGLAQSVPAEEVDAFLRGGVSPLCAPTMLCSFGLYGSQPLPHQAEPLFPQGGPEEAPRPVVAAPRQAAPADAALSSASVAASGSAAASASLDASGLDATGLDGTGLAPTYAPPARPRAAAADEGIDYTASIGLRGQYGFGGESAGLEIVVVPQARVSVTGSRLSAEASASAELIQDIPGEPALEALDLSAGANYVLDSRTQASLEATVRLARDAVSGADAMPSAVMTAPLAFTGGLDAEIVRTVGRNSYGVGVSLMREDAGADDVADGDLTTAGDGGLTRAGLDLRLTRQIGPGVALLGEAGATRTLYDRAGGDTWFYAAAAGVAAEWRALSGEALVGIGLRDADADLAVEGEGESLTFSASLAYLALPTLTLEAGFSSALLPGFESESGTSARQNAVTVSAAYAASSWLGITADASYLWERGVDGAHVYETYRAGLGAELAISRNATLSAGYDYAATDRLASETDAEHRVTLGITLAR